MTREEMHDTLNSMNCLGEMNADNLEKMILRLPRWARGGSTMPTFHNIVDFLKDRADVANHPFFSKTSESNRDEKVFGGGQRRSSERRTILTTRSNNRDDVLKEQLCPVCNNLHPLYGCEVFKSESPEERGDFVKRNRICFNCINSKEHTVSHEHATLPSVAEVLDAENLTIRSGLFQIRQSTSCPQANCIFTSNDYFNGFFRFKYF